MQEEHEISNNKMNIPVHDDPEVLANLGMLAAKIAYQNFEWRYITLVMISTTVQSIALKTFLMNYKRSVIIKQGPFTRRYRARISQFVIFGYESMEISDILQWIVRSKCDTTGKFIVVCHSREYAKCDETQVFQTLADQLILNVVYLKASYNGNDLKSYSYEIVLPDNCLNYKPKEVDLVTQCNNNSCLKRIFPEKLKRFHGCPLHISTVEQPPFMYLKNNSSPSGRDGGIVRLVANILNATLVMITPAEQECGHYENDNWTGSLGDVYNGHAHVSMCAAPLTSYKYGNFQISSPYYYIDIVWAARLPPLRPSWEKLLYPLSAHFWITLLLIFIGIVFMNIFAKTNIWNKVRRVFKLEPPKRSYLFYSWALFLGMPIRSEPRKFSIRIVVYTWIWFCFIMRYAYQAALISSLKMHVYQQELKTYKDVLNYPYGGSLTLRDYYLEDREVYDNWTFLPERATYYILDKILNGSTDFIIALNKEVIDHRLIQYNGTKQLQILPEIIVTSPTVMYFKRYSPLTVPISNILNTAFEAGFIQFSYRWNLKYETYFLHKSKILHGPHPLTMEHFSGCCVLLIMGLILAIISFIVEVIRGRAIKNCI